MPGTIRALLRSCLARATRLPGWWILPLVLAGIAFWAGLAWLLA